MDFSKKGNKESVVLLSTSLITSTNASKTKGGKQNGFSTMQDIRDNLPVVTNGHHAECTTETITTIYRNGHAAESEAVKDPKPVTRIQVHQSQVQSDEVPVTIPSETEFKNGPDQYIPSNDLYTVQANGRVKIQFEKEGIASLKPVSVPTLLHQTATEYPNSVALAAKGEDGTWQKITYKEYETLVRTCAKAFIKLGLKKYHSVCILGFNTPEWFISDMAAIFAGGFAAGIYTTNSAESCFYCAENSKANIIVVQDKQQLDKILEIKDRLPHLKAIIQYDGKATNEGVISWEEMMKIGSEQPDTDLDNVLKTIAVNECCTLVYTSGTTGHPKGTMLSHDNLTWTSRAASEYLQTVKCEEVVVSYLPLSHVAAQIVDIYVALTSVAAVYFGDSNALKGSLVNTLQEARPTQFLGVPRVWEKINEKMVLAGAQASGLKSRIAAWAKGVGFQHNIDRMNGVDGFSLQYMLANALVFKRVRKALGFERCKLMLSGAAPLSTDIKKYFWSLDLPVLEGFGMSETSGCHSLNITTAFRLESIGKTLPGCLTKIEHPDSNNQGEIMLKGRNIYMGYLNELVKTEETFDEEGWFHSGDLGTIDHEEFVYITGRMKELIITAGGENISPVLIENVIKEELPCISNAVLIGDQRKFLSILLTLRTETVLETGEPLDQLNKVSLDWCRGIGCSPNTVTEVLASKNEKVYAAIQAGIDRANAKAISNAQRVQKFAILPKDFSVGTDELGPTMKVKRNVVVKKNADLIEFFYSC